LTDVRDAARIGRERPSTEAPIPEHAASKDWQPARLIPVAGIRGQDEQEARATSAFLAVLSVVPAFAHEILGSFGAPRGRLETYSEVRFKDANGKSHRPDGAIVATRGTKSWTALVEVKTGTANIAEEQVNRYLDIARDSGFDCVITISNEIVGSAIEVPYAYDRRKTRRVGLYHLSWWRILTLAVLEHRHRGVADPEQAWILGELIAYLDHEKSGASGFQDMGRAWVSVRDASRQGTLRATDPGVRQVAQRWDQLVDYLALGLAQELGREVTPIRSRKQTHADRVADHVKRLSVAGELVAAVKVPDAVAPIGVAADLRARQVTSSVQIQAPGDGRQATRINWLLRQLRNADPRLRVTASFANTRETSSVLLGEVRENPDGLLSTTDRRREIRGFEVALTRPMGLKAGRGAGSFVGDTRAQLFAFYGDVVQDLAQWQRKAPRLPDSIADDRIADEPPVVEPSADVEPEIATPELEEIVTSEADEPRPSWEWDTAAREGGTPQEANEWGSSGGQTERPRS
jgi:hypothetical protein